MASTIYQAVGREYVSSIPIVQTFNAFQTKLLYGSVLLIGAAAGYFYLTGQLSEASSDVPDM